eukprot:3756029-Prymnesium_polylepis.2
MVSWSLSDHTVKLSMNSQRYLNHGITADATYSSTAALAHFELSPLAGAGSLGGKIMPGSRNGLSFVGLLSGAPCPLRVARATAG